MKAQAEIISEIPYKGGYLVQLSTAEPTGLSGTVNVSITKKGAKRSLDANGYYWELVEKIAHDRTEPKPQIHNKMLRDYGTLARAGEFLVTLTFPDTDETFDRLLREEDYHVYPTTERWTDEEGNPFRTYYLIKGSRYYDTAEMSQLINGAVEEAKALGIETATPEEIKRMEALYGEKNKASR